MSPKIKNIGLGAQGHVQKSRKHRNEGFEGFPIMKSKSDKFKLKQDNITELLNIIYIPKKIPCELPNNRNQCQKCMCFHVVSEFAIGNQP